MINYIKNSISEISTNEFIIIGSVIVYFCIKFLTINNN